MINEILEAIDKSRPVDIKKIIGEELTNRTLNLIGERKKQIVAESYDSGELSNKDIFNKLESIKEQKFNLIVNQLTEVLTNEFDHLPESNIQELSPETVDSAVTKRGYSANADKSRMMTDKKTKTIHGHSHYEHPTKKPVKIRITQPETGHSTARKA